MIARFAREDTDPLVAHAPYFRLIIGSRQRVAQFEQCRHPLLDRRAQQHRQFVFTRPEPLLHIHCPLAKHIVGPQDEYPVEKHIPIGIDAVEKQFEMLEGQQAVTDKEAIAVFPVDLIDPLLFALIHAVVRIFDAAIVQQIRVHATRHDGRHPGFAGFGLAERPAVVEQLLGDAPGRLSKRRRHKQPLKGEQGGQCKRPVAAACQGREQIPPGRLYGPGHKQIH